MKNVKSCQRYASPLAKPKDFGTTVDGIKSNDYCNACYDDGTLYGDAEMKTEDMIDICAPFFVAAGKYENTDEARDALRKIFTKFSNAFVV